MKRAADVPGGSTESCVAAGFDLPTASTTVGWLALFARRLVTSHRRTLDSLIVDSDGTVIVSTTQDLRHDGLPRAACQVYRG